jgi:hypothetical protein
MRVIDWSKPLSDEDREWLAQAGIPGTRERIADNDALFGNESDEDDDTQDDEEGGRNYESYTVAELKAIGAKREPAVSFDGAKTKADVIAALVEWDEDEENGEHEEDD